MAALKQNTGYDYLGMGVAIFGVSVPVIVLGPILVWLFGVYFKSGCRPQVGEPNHRIYSASCPRTWVGIFSAMPSCRRSPWAWDPQPSSQD